MESESEVDRQTQELRKEIVKRERKDVCKIIEQKTAKLSISEACTCIQDVHIAYGGTYVCMYVLTYIHTYCKISHIHTHIRNFYNTHHHNNNNNRSDADFVKGILYNT